jgi:hypothetical protein
MPESVRRTFKVYIVKVESEMARPEQRAARLGVPGGIECLHRDDDDWAPGCDLTERRQWAVGIGIEAFERSKTIRARKTQRYLVDQGDVAVCRGGFDGSAHADGRRLLAPTASSRTARRSRRSCGIIMHRGRHGSPRRRRLFSTHNSVSVPRHTKSSPPWPPLGKIPPLRGRRGKQEPDRTG